MAAHKLSLEIPETSNELILKIFDQSVYTNLIPIVCPQILITVPGFQYSAVIPEDRLDEGFSLTLTACDLDIQHSNCDSVMNPLSDGIYAIKYQVSPHEYVFVEYNHLRLTNAKLRIQDLLCNLDLGNCIPSREKEQKLDQIRDVQIHLDAAKAEVEYGHNPKKGMDIYNYSLKMLDKISCRNC